MKQGKEKSQYITLITLAKYYGVTVDYLLGLTDEQGNPS